MLSLIVILLVSYSLGIPVVKEERDKRGNYRKQWNYCSLLGYFNELEANKALIYGFILAIFTTFGHFHGF